MSLKNGQPDVKSSDRPPLKDKRDDNEVLNVTVDVCISVFVCGCIYVCINKKCMYV
jgi:hypothetical protein